MLSTIFVRAQAWLVYCICITTCTSKMISTGSPSVNELKPAIVPSKTAPNSTGVGGTVLQQQLATLAINDPTSHPSSSSAGVPGHTTGTVHPVSRFGQILWIFLTQCGWWRGVT